MHDGLNFWFALQGTSKLARFYDSSGFAAEFY
jgi:hypothetical protein